MVEGCWLEEAGGGPSFVVGLGNLSASLSLALSYGTLVAHSVKNLPAMQETWVQSLRSVRCPREGNGNPLQCSCLENPMDRGAWRATWSCRESDTTE